MPYLGHPDTIQNGTCATVAGTTPVAAAALATIPAITTAGIAIGRHGNVKVEAQRCLTYLFIFVFFLLLCALRLFVIKVKSTEACSSDLATNYYYL